MKAVASDVYVEDSQYEDLKVRIIISGPESPTQGPSYCLENIYHKS